MAEFDITKLFQDVSELDTGAKAGQKKLSYLDISVLHPDPDNFYELSGIEELAANIELFGLQQPVLVRPAEDGYIIVSGHRRTAAIRQLVEEGREDLRQVPCLIEDAPGSPELQKLRLIYANSDTRRMSSAELARQAEEVEALLYALKEQGMEFPGRMRDYVAEACKMSKSKLARLKVIRDNLKPAVLREAWEAGRLNESCAYEIARRSETAQDMASQLLHRITAISAEELAALMDGLERQAESHERVQKSVEAACTRFAAGASAGPGVEECLAARWQDDRDFFSLLEVYVEGFIRRAGTMGVCRKDNIQSLQRGLRNSGAGCSEHAYSAYGSKGLQLSSMARAIEPITRNWAETYDMLAAIAINRLREMPRQAEPESPADCQGPATADACEPKWFDGLPRKAGRYVARFDLGGGDSIDHLVEYDAWDRIFYFAYGDAPVEFPCIGWWPVPDGQEEEYGIPADDWEDDE